MSTWFAAYGFAEILDTLVIGAYPRDEKDVQMLELLGIERVLNLVGDGEYGPDEREAVADAYARAGIAEQRVGFEDFGHLPADRLGSAVQTVVGWQDEGLRCYAHCRAGQQRSVAVAIGVVAIRNRLELAEAMALVKRRKPSAAPLPHQLDDLRSWWAEYGSPEAA